MSHDVSTPTRRLLLVTCSALFAAGCGNLIGPPSSPLRLYVLRPGGGASTHGPSVTWSLSVETTTTSDHIDSARIALVQADNSADYYADSAWTDRVPKLVRDCIVEAFENSNRILAVSAVGDGFYSDYVLQAELRDFEARYRQSDGIPIVRVRIKAKIAPTKGREIVGSLNSVHEVAASENSVPAVVRAFDDALGSVLSDIVNWSLGAVPPK